VRLSQDFPHDRPEVGLKLKLMLLERLKDLLQILRTEKLPHGASLDARLGGCDVVRQALVKDSGSSGVARGCSLLLFIFSHF